MVADMPRGTVSSADGAAGAAVCICHVLALRGFAHICLQDLSSTYRIEVVGCMKRYICCGALPQLAGSCDPYLCLDVGNTRYGRSCQQLPA